MTPVQISGVILRTVGRACAGPLAVVLHEYSSGIEALDNQMGACPRPRPTQSPGCHTSFHYGLGGCTFHQYVPLADTAWGFGVTPPSCPEPLCPPDVCESCTGLTQAQFNADMDGNLPVLPVGWTVAGPDGTANCRAIHVAVTSLFPTNQNLGSGPCCDPNARAYQCLLEALCEIFAEAGLTPSQTTLLVHCNEHLCLDIDQLVTDVLAYDCTPTSVSPCLNCPPVTPEDICALLADLDAGDDGVAGVDSYVGADCLTHLLPAPTAPIAANIGAGSIDVNDDAAADELFLSVTGNQIINAPTGPGSRFEISIKNVSAVPITITGAAAETMDGQNVLTLAGTIPAGYPFGNDGGEAVHLVWNTGSGEWKVF